TAYQRITEKTYDLVILGYDASASEVAKMLDQIARHQPDAAVITLTEREQAIRDPRIAARIVKSRQSVEEINATVRHVLSRRLPQPAE
ncbi:hypothetical protein, partial [Stappia sp.]|uniref:hypothetical protein n=1 Tax=Stappia sp. TaxID=1870903 RepID=UPI003A9A5567